MTDITNHLKKLSERCRVCGTKIKLSKGYKEPKATRFDKNELQLMFGINIEEDQTEIHPTNLCNKCFLKLYHFSKRQSTTDVATNSNISETNSFVPHTEDSEKQ